MLPPFITIQTPLSNKIVTTILFNPADLRTILSNIQKLIAKVCKLTPQA